MSNFEYDDRARQLMSFEGLNTIRGIVPTDIDGFIDFNENLFIIFEGKVQGTPMKYGQKKSFEALCNVVSYYNDSLVKSLGIEKEYPFKKVMFIILFEHNVSTDNDVIVKDQYVSEIYDSIDLYWKNSTTTNLILNFKKDDKGKLTVNNAIKQIIDWCYENNVQI